MSDLHAVATIQAAEGTGEQVRAALTTLAEATRNESGCVSYDLYESAAEPGTFVTIERWRSQDDLDAHLKTPHVAEAMSSQGANIADLTVHPLREV